MHYAYTCCVIIALVFVVMNEDRDRHLRFDKPNCRNIGSCMDKDMGLTLVKTKYTKTATEMLDLLLFYNDFSNYNVYWRIAVLGL